MMLTRDKAKASTELRLTMKSGISITKCHTFIGNFVRKSSTESGVDIHQLSVNSDGRLREMSEAQRNFQLSLCVMTYLCFELVVEVRVIEFDKAEKQGALLDDGVVPGNFLLHVLLQEGHVAQEATREGPQQLEQQLDLGVVAPFGWETRS